MWFFGFDQYYFTSDTRTEKKHLSCPAPELHDRKFHWHVSGFKTYLANQNMHADETEFCIKAT